MQTEPRTDPQTSLQPTVRTTCRGCGSRDLHIVFSLDGAHYVNDFPTSAGTRAHPPVPLYLARCGRDACGLVQLTHTTPWQWMFGGTFWYLSRINPVMQAELKDVVKQALKRVDLQPGAVVVDIGANDGTLLSCYPDLTKVKPLIRVAFEPSLNCYDALRPHANVLYPEPFKVKDWPEEQRAQIITAIAMLYDLDDAGTFLDDVVKVLHPDGVFVVQVGYLPLMLAATDVSTICLPAWDRIITSKGLQAIETVRTGDCVLTHTGEYRPVLATHQREYDGDLVELQAYGFGHRLQVTPNHPVFVYRDGRWDWIPAEAVRHGDAVGRPIPRTTAPEELPCWAGRRWDRRERTVPIDELLEIFGYYLAEGSVDGRGAVVFHFGLHEQALVDDCLARVQALGFSASHRKTRTSWTVLVSRHLGRLLEEHCGRGASGKRLAPWFFGLTQEQSARVLRAYVAGDGYPYRAKYFRASTVSEQLALDIAMLANRCGWKASISEQQRSAVCMIERRIVTQLPLWDVLIHTDPQKNIKVWMQDGMQCGRVRHVARVPYQGTVHNLEVAGNQSYVSPAMTVHNCHEHLVYFSLRSLSYQLARHGLDVIDVELRAINAGSLRVYIQHAGRSQPSRRARERLEAEDRFLANPDELWAGFRRRADAAKRQLQTLVAAYLERDGVLDLYAASTKGGTLLQWADLDARVIRQAWERNQEKHGHFYGASGIPIVSEEEGRSDPPSALITTIWQFRDAVLKREAKYLAAGGTMIMPLPTVEVVHGDLSGGAVQSKD